MGQVVREAVVVAGTTIVTNRDEMHSEEHWKMQVTSSIVEELASRYKKALLEGIMPLASKVKPGESFQIRQEPLVAFLNTDTMPMASPSADPKVKDIQNPLPKKIAKKLVGEITS